MEVLSCLEHQPIPIREHRKAGDFALSHSQAKQLRNSKVIPTDAFRWGHECIIWRQFCGVVQLDGLTLEILPKLHGKESDPGACKDALLTMLRKAKRLRLFKGAAASIQTRKSSLLDIFIREFCMLLDAQLAMGMPRDYRQNEENLGVVRGKLMINQQLRHNLCHRERLYCQYDELTADIPINHIVKFTLELLLPCAGTSATRQILAELSMKHDEITSCQVTLSDIEKVVLTRATDRYLPILSWCRIFISALSPDVTAGDNTLLSILFNMNELFEKWLATELKPIAHSHGLSVREQSPRKYLAVRPDIDRAVFQTKPDISLIDRSGRHRVLVDAKWKILSGDEAKLGISQADLYQLVSYANLYRLTNVVLVYPLHGLLQEQYTLQVPGIHKVTVTIACVDITRSDFRSVLLKLVELCL